MKTEIKTASFNDALGSLSLEQQYRICLYGKNAYSTGEWDKLTQRRKREVNNLHNRAQNSLNILKQKAVIELSDQALKCWRQHKIDGVTVKRNIIDTVVETKSTCQKYFCNLSFKELGITKSIAQRWLINENIIRVQKAS